MFFSPLSLPPRPPLSAFGLRRDSPSFGFGLYDAGSFCSDGLAMKNKRWRSLNDVGSFHSGCQGPERLVLIPVSHTFSPER